LHCPFDTAEEANLDRLIGATATDAWLRRSKAHIAQRLLAETSTAARSKLRVWEHSICEPQGLDVALDFDVVVSCVDRPWPRAVLNAIAYRDLIPVIDGGIAIDAFPDGKGMRTAIWRSHVIRPGRPCLSCNNQLDLGAVGADKAGALEDPAYIAGLGEAAAPVGGQNVAVLSISAAASILAQYVSLNVAPGGIGEPGPLQYVLSTHTLEHLDVTSREHCPVEAVIAEGDRGPNLTGHHQAAEERRRDRAEVPIALRLGRALDDALWWGRARLATLARRSI
jgi:hypothetical protein